jgi:hypothetical protein
MREKIGFLLFLFVGEIQKCCYRWWKSLFPRKLSGLPFDTQTTQGDTQIRGMLSSDINVASAPKLVHFLIDFFFIREVHKRRANAENRTRNYREI